MAVRSDMLPDASLDIRVERDRTLISPRGDWTIGNSARLFDESEHVRVAVDTRVVVDIGDLTSLDTSGAWLIHRIVQRLEAAGLEVVTEGGTTDHLKLVSLASESDKHPEELPQPNAVYEILEDIGKNVSEIGQEMFLGLNFIGLTLTTMVRSLLQPWRISLTPLVYHIDQIGFRAVPIVSLISFLIGVVVAYQGSIQLRTFGAEVFVVELTAISIFRELGILLTAIVVAGRSGSAFTAQIGSMTLNEEIHAMRTLGLDPLERLVLPRVTALVFVLPILTFLADMMGLVGGAITASSEAGISYTVFWQRVRDGVDMSHFWVGIVKAPFFAFVIGIAGCYEGLRVEGGAESVGQRTTKSVVESIFMVIVLDALFSVVFLILEF